MIAGFYLFLAALFAFCTLTGAEPAPSPEPEKTLGYRIDFSKAKNNGKSISGWLYMGKPGTREAKFSVVRMNGVPVLKLESNRSTGCILYDISRVDLKKYPFIRWKWRADVLPVKGDGRIAAKDDQVITLYLSSGTMFSQHSKAFRWDTETPKKSSGFATYRFGMVKVHWHCIRNNSDCAGKWYVEECNALEEIKQLFKGKIPKRLILSLSCNSQYTNSSSKAYLEYIEFHSTPLNKGK